MAYTDLDTVKEYMKIPEATTVDDDLISTLIVAAQTAIDTHCRQTFEAEGDSMRTFAPYAYDDGGAVDGYDLILDAPLAAVTSVTNGDGVEVAAGDYITRPRNATPYYAIRLTANSGLRWTYTDDAEADTIAVVGKWAYSVEAPADVAFATTRLAAWFYRQRGNANDLDRAVVVGNATILPSRIPADVLSLLAPYVRGPG